jgi:cytochrome c
MDGRFNTIAGWVLGAGIVLLGSTLVAGELFKAERPETMGYAIPGVQEEGAEGGGAAAEQPIAHYLQTADAARGEAIFHRCQSCHNADNGGANGIGPNLWGTVGNTIAHRPDFAYSDALKSHTGRWDWDTLSTWLHSPSRFAPGTKMTFAGLSDPQDRADVLLFLNQHGGTLTIPPPPPAGGATPGNAATGGNEPAANTAAASQQRAHAAAASGNATQGDGPAANQAAPASANTAARH